MTVTDSVGTRRDSLRIPAFTLTSSIRHGPRLPLLAILLAGILLSDSALAAPPWTAAEFVPGESLVLLGSQRGLEFRNWPELTPAVGRFQTHLMHVHDLAFSPDGQLLLVAGGSPAESGTVEVWHWNEKRLLQEVTEHQDVVYRVAWTPDARSWISASGDGECRRSGTDASQQHWIFPGHSAAVLSVACPDHQTLISAGVDQTIRIWTLPEGRLQRTLDNHTGGVNDIAVCPKPPDPLQSLIASVSEDRTVRLWQPQIGRLLRFARLPSVPRTLAWSVGGDRLFVGCDDGKIRILSSENLQTLSEVEAFPGRIHELRIAPEGQHLLVAGESGVRAISCMPP